MSVFFFCSVIISIVFGVINGKTAEVSAAALRESAHAVELSLKLLGSLCFWSGIMEVAQKSGFTSFVEKIFRPVLAHGIWRTS